MKKNYSLLFTIYLFISVLSTTNCFAQGEANTWYFGRNAGMDFNGGAPVSLAGGQINTREGGATISDAAGNLLFYTDGITVWDRNHTIMPNGTVLLGDSSSTQSAIIVQKPNSANIYYIFTSGARANALGITYSEVDLSLNGGFGDVTANKNILLNTPTCEKLTAVRHCNQTDIWVITHDWNSNVFRTYLVTAAGVNQTPVLSNAGLIPTGNTIASIGQMKASPNGEKLATASDGAGATVPINRFELFDFDKTTGIVSNAITLTPLPAQLSAPAGCYGIEFSPDGSKLYGTTLTPANVFQYNLCAGSNTAIANSGVLVGSTTAVNGCLQLGPDKKIYLAKENANTVGVINNPNALGVACNFVSNGLTLTSGLGQLGLPNFLPIKQPPPPFTSTSICLTANFNVPVINSANCTNMASSIVSVLWNFGDPASGTNDSSTSNNPNHVYPAPGTYAVTLILNYACGSDTIQQNITLTNIILSSQNPTICKGNSFVLPDGSTVNTSGVYVDTIITTAGCDSIITTNLTVSPLITSIQNVSICYGKTYQGPNGPVNTSGIYSDTVLTAGGCDSAFTLNLTINPIITFTQNISICSGKTYPGPSGPLSTAGTYTDTVTTAGGCDSAVTTVLTVLPNSASSQSYTVCSKDGFTLSDGTTTYTSGIYRDTVNSSNGCDSVITITLTVNPSPTVGVSPDTTINLGSSVTLTATGNGTFSWSPATGLNTTSGSTVIATPNETTTYCVVLTDANGCTDSICVTVFVDTPCPVKADFLALPNAFSPNLDGMNDYFCLQGWEVCVEEFTVYIFDRWGEKVFESNEPDFCWDGKYLNRFMDAQVFVYYISGKYKEEGKTFVRKGNISMLR